jgi:hypothetical protein
MRFARPVLRLTLSCLVVLNLALGGCRALIGTSPFELAGDGGTSSSQSTGSGMDGSASSDATTGDSDSPSSVGDGDAGPGAPDVRDEGPSSNDAGPDITVSGDGGIALVQAAATGPIASLLTVSVDFNLPVTAHDAIVVGVNYDSTSPPEITDTLNSRFLQAVSVVEDAGSPALGVNAIWFALDVAGGNDRVTVSIASASYSYFEVFIHEYSGIAALDGTTSQIGATSSGNNGMQTGFVTTTKAGDLIFAMGVDGAVSPGDGFTVETSSNSDITEDLIAGPPGPYQATATASFGGWCLTMAAFRGF